MPRDVSSETVDGRRLYTTPDGVFPSVTTILRATKPEEDVASLEAWRERVGHDEAARISQAAIDRGDQIHQAIEAWAAGDMPAVSAENYGWWESLSGIRTDLAPFLPAYGIEAAVWHPVMRYAGTIDMAAQFRAHHCVLDWKTSSKPKRREWVRDYELQIAAYVCAPCRSFDLPKGVVIDSGAVIIALQDRDAQEILLTPHDVMERFAEFSDRVAQYWDDHKPPLSFYGEAASDA